MRALVPAHTAARGCWVSLNYTLGSLLTPDLSGHNTRVKASERLPWNRGAAPPRGSSTPWQPGWRRSAVITARALPKAATRRQQQQGVLMAEGRAKKWKTLGLA